MRGTAAATAWAASSVRTVVSVVTTQADGAAGKLAAAFIGHFEKTGETFVGERGGANLAEYPAHNTNVDAARSATVPEQCAPFLPKAISGQPRVISGELG